MLRFVFGALLLAASASTVAVSADPPKMTAVDQLRAGQFHSAGNYLSNLKVAHWANRYLMTGYVAYGSNQYEFEATVVPNKEGATNAFIGEGVIKQRWARERICRYTLRLEVFAYEDSRTRQVLFVRSFAPQSIYSHWDVAGKGCPPPADGYDWVTNEKPYYSKPLVASAPPPFSVPQP